MNIANISVNRANAIARMSGGTPITSGMVGVTVTFEYDDPVWNGLHKTAVFTAGKVTRDGLNADSVVTVPAEVLKKAGALLRIGVYGTDNDGNLVVPTVMAPIGMILPGAKPSGNPGTGSGSGGGSGGTGGSIIVDDEGYLTTTSGGFDVDADGYILM